MKSISIKILIFISIFLILIGYILPFTHVSYLGTDGQYIRYIYENWKDNLDFSFVDLFFLIPIIAVLLSILILISRMSYSWFLPIGSTFSILSSTFAYFYIQQSGYNLMQVGLGWLLFYLSGQILLVIGLISILKDFEADNVFKESKERNIRNYFKIILSLFKFSFFVCLSFFIFKSCSDNEKVYDIPHQFRDIDETIDPESMLSKDVSRDEFLIGLTAIRMQKFNCKTISAVAKHRGGGVRFTCNNYTKKYVVTKEDKKFVVVELD